MIQFPSIVDNIRTLKDGGLKVTLETPELKAEDITKLFEYRNKEVNTAMSERLVSPDDLKIEDEKLEFKSDKSKSQRLRSVLFVYWNKNKPTKDFQEYYNRKMEEIINLIKDKLN